MRFRQGDALGRAPWVEEPAQVHKGPAQVHQRLRLPRQHLWRRSVPVGGGVGLGGTRIDLRAGTAGRRVDAWRVLVLVCVLRRRRVGRVEASGILEPEVVLIHDRRVVPLALVAPVLLSWDGERNDWEARGGHSHEPGAETKRSLDTEWDVVEGRRSLLWRRGSDMETKGLSRITFPPDRINSSPPSWSWMAYTGGIDYLTLEFGGLEWMDIGSPWSRNADNVARSDDSAVGMALTAEARNYKYDPKEYNVNAVYQKEGLLFFDRPESSEQTGALCVVLGIEKGKRPLGEKLHYLILVKATEGIDRNGSQIYERVGAGYLPGRRIAPEAVKVTIH
jgi:hypothetical protein